MKKKLAICFQTCLCALLLFGSSLLAADKPVKIIFENVYTASHVRLGEKATVGMWLEELNKQGKGMIDIETHWGGEPVPTKETLDALSKGLIDMLVAYPPFFGGQVGIADVCAMPTNFKNYQDIYDLWWNSPMAAIIDRVYQKRFNVKALFPIIFGPQNFQIGKRTKKIQKFEDFQGLKIRAGGGMPNFAVKAIGGSPVATVGGEYYTAMQKGIIDAGIMGTYSLKTYRMWEVCDQVVNPPLFPHSWVLAWMNLDKWNSLDPKLQKLIIDSARAIVPKWISFVENDDEAIRKEAKEKYGVEFYTLPKEDVVKMEHATEPLWDTYVKQNEAQGFGKEAQELRQIIQKRYNSQK